MINRIPYCVVLMMINDVGRMRKKEDEEDIIQTEEEELKFLGLL